MKKTFVFVILVVAVLLCGCKKKVDMPDIPQVNEPAAEESDVIIKDDIFSETTDFDIGVSAEVYITAPKVEAPEYGENVDKLNQLFEMCADTVKNEYFHDVSIGESSEGAAATSRMLTYDVYTAKDGYVSVLLKITSSIAGGVHPTEAYRCISYDLKEGKLLSLADVVGEDKVDSVKALIIDRMKKTPEKYYTAEDDALDEIDISYSFLEKDDIIYIVIDEYAIAPRSEGVQIFEINKGDIG